MKRIQVLWALGVLGVIAIIAVLLVPESKDFPAGHPGPTVEVVVSNGAGGLAIGAALQSAGVIKEKTKFFQLAVKDSRAKSIAPGVHRVESHLPVSQALAEMIDPKRLIGIVEISEGSTFSDVQKSLRANSSIAASASSLLAKIAPAIANPTNSLEGQIYPARYSFEPGTTEFAAIKSMVAKFKNSSTFLNLQRGYLTYTPYQVLVIASLAQIEGDPQDFAKVAQVIYNRLKIGMPLQLNSSVQFAAKLRGQISLSLSATKIDSPYNTYKNIGLPPTPISNPSDMAIMASLHPEPGSWLYFITVAPGDTRFTARYSEFQQWNQLFQKNLAAGAFK